jgi:hypothetical protein
MAAQREKKLTEAITACQILFSAKFNLAKGIMPYLRIEDAEAAYAGLMEMYVAAKFKPDRSNRDFTIGNLKKLARVYDVLAAFIRAYSESEKIRKDDGRQPRTLYYKGSPPSRRLRFASYLYYRGAITRGMRDESLAWQKSSRPLMGQLAMKKGMINAYDFARILVHLKEGESFGVVARRLGILNQAQIRDILKKQLQYNCPIGKYFIDQGILRQDQIDRLHREMLNHNTRYSA